MRLTRILFGLLSFFVPALLAFSYTLNHFYVLGGFFPDSGWFAFLTTRATAWPMPNPPALGGTYFSTHASFFFYPIAFVHGLAQWLSGREIFSPVWFAASQGLWFGITGAACFALATVPRHGPVGLPHLGIALLLAVPASFSGPALGSLVFPHFEIAIPALLMAYFAALANGQRLLAAVFLLCGLTVREDAGLHYFGVLFLLWLYLEWRPLGDRAQLQGRAILKWALVCLCYATVTIAAQKYLWGGGDNALRRIYLGDPAFGHLSLDFLVERLKYYGWHRLYLTLPLLAIAAIALVRLRPLLLVGLASVTPWIAFSVLGVSGYAGTLTNYYAFPLVVAVLWPFVAGGLERAAGQDGGWWRGPVGPVSCAMPVALSIALYPGSEGNVDHTPWRNVAPHWYGRIGEQHAALRRFADENSDLGYVVDDVAASLENGRIDRRQWRYQLRYDKVDLDRLQAFVFKPAIFQAESIARLIHDAGLDAFCSLGASGFIVATRDAEVSGCSSDIPPAATRIEPALSPYLDYLNGWSHPEAAGRWTVGNTVQLPQMFVGGRSALCIRGAGFLPGPDSAVAVDILAGQRPIGGFAYTPAAPSGERCVDLPADLAASGTMRFTLRVSGFASPHALGLSSDDRDLGVFVQWIEAR